MLQESDSFYKHIIILNIWNFYFYILLYHVIFEH